MEISRRSRQRFADMAAGLGTARKIEDAYEAHGFVLPADFVPAEGAVRRSICEAAEARIDTADAAACDRLIRVYLDAIDDWGRQPPPFFGTGVPNEDPLLPAARSLLRSLQRDGVPVDDEGHLGLAGTASTLAVEKFDRLSEPRVLLEHLARIEAGIAADPAAAIGSAKELVESAFKFVLDDYGVGYARTASLTDLYKLVATELRLSREAVPSSAKGSAAAHRVLQNLATSVQGLAELRNELGLGHGRTAPSPALARHSRLASNSARAVVEFVLETWHERKREMGGGAEA